MLNINYISNIWWSNDTRSIIYAIFLALVNETVNIEYYDCWFIVNRTRWDSQGLHFINFCNNFL